LQVGIFYPTRSKEAMGYRHAGSGKREKLSAVPFKVRVSGCHLKQPHQKHLNGVIKFLYKDRQKKHGKPCRLMQWSLSEDFFSMSCQKDLFTRLNFP